jgi:LTR polyprotein gag-polypeptide-like protein
MDLTNKLQFLKCSEGDNLCTHFLDLTNLCDQLLTMGKSFSNEDFATILLRSLLDSYKMQTSSIITLVDMTNTAILPALIICMLSDEYDNHVCASKAGNSANSEALKAEDQGKGKRNNTTFSVITVTRKAISRINVGQKEEAKKANLKEIGGKAITVIKTAPIMPVLVTLNALT